MDFFFIWLQNALFGERRKVNFCHLKCPFCLHFAAHWALPPEVAAPLAIPPPPGPTTTPLNLQKAEGKGHPKTDHEGLEGE